MEYLRSTLSRLRKSPLLSIPFLSLSLPQPALTAANIPTSASASRFDLAGTGVYAVSVASYQSNEQMEDRWTINPSTAKPSYSPPGGDSQSSSNVPPCIFAAVMDGHGGWQASDFTKRSLPAVVFDECKNASDPLDPHQMTAALSRAFGRVDRSFIDSIRGAFQLGFGDVARVGCCTLAAVVTRDWLVVANAGDCRAVLGHVSRTAPEGSLLQAATQEDEQSGGKFSTDALAAHSPSASGEETLYVTALPLSDDHNARIPREVARLRASHPGERDIVVSNCADTTCSTSDPPC
jgi:hypothetical protein